MPGKEHALPGNVGILGIEFYFPRNYVKQPNLAKYMNVEPAKYTKGFGQDEMGFCGDHEDANSLALTVTQRLLENYKIDPLTIGYLAVGTESETDKSKSVKTYLMDLFVESGNFNIGGVDLKNACYGGTAALEACITWVSTFQFKKKMAIAVMTDIAVYENGPARPTGGAGAIAILVGVDAPVVFCRGTGNDMRNNNDFCKPLRPKNTEYPVVNGQTSLEAYMGALDECYKRFKKDMKEYCNEAVTIASFDSVAFHCPYARLVEKAFGRLLLTDFIDGKFELDDSTLAELSKYEKTDLMDLKRYLTDKTFMSIWQKAAANEWRKKTLANLEFNKRIGNMYTPSLYAQLVGLIARLPENFEQHRVLLFSYGSGSCSGMFSYTITPSASLTQMRKSGKDALKRLDERIEFSAEDYSAILKAREEFMEHDAPKKPNFEWSQKLKMFPGTFYLKQVDQNYVRSYEKYSDPSITENGHH